MSKIIGVTVGTPLSPSFIRQKFKPMEDKVNELQEAVEDLKYVPIEITSFSIGTSVVEMGSVVTSVWLNWKCNKTPVLLKLDNREFTPTTTDFALSGLQLRENKTYTLTATDERERTVSKNASITFLNGVYYGALETGAEVDSAAILGLTRKLQGSKALTFTVTAGATQKIVYALPARYGNPNFNVGGFDGGFVLAKTFDFTNASGYTESYNVWMSENAGLGETKVVVS